MQHFKAYISRFKPGRLPSIMVLAVTRVRSLTDSDLSGYSSARTPPGQYASLKT